MMQFSLVVVAVVVYITASQRFSLLITHIGR